MSSVFMGTDGFNNSYSAILNTFTKEFDTIMHMKAAGLSSDLQTIIEMEFK